ncbi:Crp/Fnr family transcriptional regulator [Paenibacillus sediminis]|uniref:CRP/FNR family transcriptional regulator n=1 Tax=Paenibacillus sediminis TaxID=664909 RepID=A0ABS4H3Y0_9BACL|nr:Crp/Fnr family transcriptional regulator [Paenibacillus sediminis]MBP1937248.1 CRP/FNR family transcriptional regulator [Paenibacillus sediminis]
MDIDARRMDSEVNTFFTEGNFNKLQSIMYYRHVSAGSNLFWEGDEAGKLYYIRSGRVKLKKSTDEGRDFILSICRQGDLIGEYGGWGPLHFTYSAEVIENAEIGIIQEKDLEVLLYQHGDLALEFTKWLGLMHRTTQSKFRDLMLYGKPGALASTLIRMSNTYGVQCEDGIRLDIKLTNTDFADLIGATRESVNRMLNDLKTSGTLDTVQGKIVIRRLEDLRCICNCPKFPSCPKEICRI